MFIILRFMCELELPVFRTLTSDQKQNDLIRLLLEFAALVSELEA
ncbi:hypothetical protein [Candidatus Nitrotoga sp. M5]|nr:hypothetical protein [Candidatus Nitrotoga sp. M5]